MSEESQRRVAVVTGASQGIGSGIAGRLAADGWDLALVARRRELLEDLGNSLGAESAIVAFPCDVSDAEAVEGAFARIHERFGRIDALINNAGITRDALLVRMRLEQWREVMAVNLDGAYHCLRAAAPIMMRARRGRIVNVSSVVGVMGNAGQANYAASKAGMIGLTRAAARELAGRGVTVNAVAPGFIETEMTRDLPRSSVEQMLGQIPQGRFGSVEDVAGVVRFLLSKDAAYITGQVIHCDGGMLMA